MCGERFYAQASTDFHCPCVFKCTIVITQVLFCASKSTMNIVKMTCAYNYFISAPAAEGRILDASPVRQKRYHISSHV